MLVEANVQLGNYAARDRDPELFLQQRAQELPVVSSGAVRRFTELVGVSEPTHLHLLTAKVEMLLSKFPKDFLRRSE
jgi:hypothetical protein